jgi:hypothetical protein
MECALSLFNLRTSHYSYSTTKLLNLKMRPPNTPACLEPIIIQTHPDGNLAVVAKDGGLSTGRV